MDQLIKVKKDVYNKYRFTVARILAQKARRIILWSDIRFEDAHRLYAQPAFVRSPRRYTHNINNSIKAHPTLMKGICL